MVKQHESELLFRRGRLHEGREQWNLAIEQYRECHDIRSWQLEQNSNFPTLAHRYLQSGIAMARCHQENGSPEDSQNVARECVERAASFPKKWSVDPAFKQDIQELTRFAEGP